ncbi:MAG: SIS domain-containing protein [Burkholderiales bacterium]|nr:SIS domain-containing protein [Anaerolineae bacterium]
MTASHGAHTLAEITSQPEVWKSAVSAFQQKADAFRTLFDAGHFDRIIVTGCGSTYYLAQIAAALFQQSGIAARAYPASEIALFPDLVFIPKSNPLLLTVSRSGETTETLQAVRVFRERTGSPMVTVTCYGDSTLAASADLAVVIPEAQETSLAQTRSFASMLIVVQGLAATLGSRSDLDVLSQLGGTASRLIDGYHDLARQLGQDRRIERFFFLGSGALYGIACEAMLKMKEMSLSYSEAFHVLEFRHGPMSMVDEHALVIGLLSDEAHAQEAAVLRDMRARGAQILTLAEQDYGLASASHFIPLASGLPSWARPVVYLPMLQLMAYHRALSNGQNPDQPANLEFVISLDQSMM